MPISIAKAQQQALDEGLLDNLGTEQGAPVRLGITEKVLAQYGAEFLQVMGKLVNERKVVASGDLTSEASFRVVDGNTLQIIVPNYFDYPNEGVRGVNSSRNAPGSPYKFKTYGMNKEGRDKIRDYIRSGRAKIANVQQDKAFGIGLEGKRKPLLEARTDTMIYMIKRYGIKATNYFNDAIKQTFKDFELKMSEAVGADIVFTLQKITDGNNSK